MKVHLLSGEVLEVEGDTPVLQENGLYRFDKFVDTGNVWVMMTTPTKDPLIPATNLKMIERC